MKVEHRHNVGAKDSLSDKGVWWDFGDLKYFELCDIFEDLEDANAAVRQEFEDVCEERGLSESMGGEQLEPCKGGNMVFVGLEDKERRETWSICLKECMLR